jgi:hypothetical protein
MVFLGEEIESFPFKVFGADFYDARSGLPDLNWKEVNLLLVNEQIYAHWEEEVERLLKRFSNLNILILPSSRRKLGLTGERLQSLLEKIAGSQFLKRGS